MSLYFLNPSWFIWKSRFHSLVFLRSNFYCLTGFAVHGKYGGIIVYQVSADVLYLCGIAQVRGTLCPLVFLRGNFYCLSRCGVHGKYGRIVIRNNLINCKCWCPLPLELLESEVHWEWWCTPFSLWLQTSLLTEFQDSQDYIGRLHPKTKNRKTPKMVRGAFTDWKWPLCLCSPHLPFPS